MAAVKSVVSAFSSAALLVVLIMALVATHSAQAQTCPTQLGNLNVCAPFVLPGAPATSPSTECCSALHAVEQDCLCNTLRIASRLPTLCNLPPLSCNAN